MSDDPRPLGVVASAAFHRSAHTDQSRWAEVAAAVEAEVLHRQAETHVLVPKPVARTIAGMRRRGWEVSGPVAWAVDQITDLVPKPDPLDEIVEQLKAKWTSPPSELEVIVCHLAEDADALRTLLARHEDGQA